MTRSFYDPEAIPGLPPTPEKFKRSPSSGLASSSSSPFQERSTPSPFQDAPSVKGTPAQLHRQTTLTPSSLLCDDSQLPVTPTPLPSLNMTVPALVVTPVRDEEASSTAPGLATGSISANGNTGMKTPRRSKRASSPSLFIITPSRTAGEAAPEPESGGQVKEDSRQHVSAGRGKLQAKPKSMPAIKPHDSPLRNKTIKASAAMVKAKGTPVQERDPNIQIPVRDSPSTPKRHKGTPWKSVVDATAIKDIPIKSTPLENVLLKRTRASSPFIGSPLSSNTAATSPLATSPISASSSTDSSPVYATPAPKTPSNNLVHHTPIKKTPVLRHYSKVTPRSTPARKILIKVNELKIRNAELESKSKAVEHQFQARVAALLSANNVLRAKTSALETETASLRRVAGHQAQRNPLEEANSLIQRLEAEVADLKYRARRNALAALGGGTGSNSSNGSNGDAQAYFKLVVLVELGYVVGTPWQKHKWGHLASA